MFSVWHWGHPRRGRCREPMGLKVVQWQRRENACEL